MRQLTPDRKASLVEGTLNILDTEPAFCLSEVDHNSPDFKGFRRYQIIYVVRGDALAEHWRDLGPAKNFKANGFRVPGGVIDTHGKCEILHTVEELREIADHLRQQVPGAERWEPTDLLKFYREDEEEKQKLALNQSNFGPVLVKTRS